ncbi:MAG: phosphatase PAP2 family protein [Paludibacteraceae bacterium]|nr:phosphatase PAP2 family protein [Paludibacteraceae bacterium]
MKEFFKQNIVFITLSLMLLIVLGSALICVPKGELHLFLCDRHTPARDIFYRYYTHVAEWLPYALCVLILLFSKVGHAALAASCIACSELTTQIIKHIVGAPRPLTWFAENMPDVQLPLVEGVRMNYWLSFPSGHTTSFFALFFALAILVGKKSATLQQEYPNTRLPLGLGLVLTMFIIPATLFILAVLGGYSRIYLSQHFPEDVFGGMCVGLLISIICYAIFSRFEDKKWYNYRILAKK